MAKKLTNVPPTPVIDVSRSSFNFGALTTGVHTPNQSFLLSNTGTGDMSWFIASSVDWLSGSYLNEPLLVVAPDASNNPQTVTVNLKVYEPGENQPPFGVFSTPTHGSTVMSSIPVTGWVLDDIGVANVKIYREVGSELAYIGDAVFVEGARPDVEQAYPDYPMNYKAGWGYMLLTNFLPNGGNGTFVLHAQATDYEGNVATLGTKTITCDNANAVKPFGAIDTPVQGGEISGSSFLNWGWALTPQPNTIPTDGSTINTWVDGVSVGHPVYNLYRSDIASLFPGYENSSGAVGYFSLDTTAYSNGVHTIAWTWICRPL